MTRRTSLISLRAYLYASLAMLFWGLSFVWFKLVIVQYQPITIIFLRLIASGLMLFVFLLLTGKAQRIRKGDLKWFLLLAFTQPFAYFLGESFGLQLVSSTLSAVIISTIPLFSPIAAYLFVKEKISSELVAGILCSFIGIILMLINPDLSFTASLRGVLLLFIAVFAAVAYSVVIRKIPAYYNAGTIIFSQNIIGALYFLPLFLVFDYHNFIQIRPDRNVLLAMLQLAFFASTLSYLFYIIAIREIGVVRSNVLTNLIPVFTAIFSYYILAEKFTAVKILGMSIVMLGIFISQYRSLSALLFKRGKML
jgi:drug/metabolite transporter (DMT)-like permease